ncbi:Calcium homeostasis modulator protein 4 [Labeo rohita]|uniref:Calcium homeostasis modulator protein 4 n=1 Tax=Labeo rohita TaxID=84645 RepID=A0ABQ8LLG9_LABRO|nr:Calcium homeostasis modulator protein 4 [Labeo rohita]
MTQAKAVLKNIEEFLKEKAVFTTFPLSLLLIGLEKLTEVEFFSCPCRVELNALLTASIFIGPALFTFTLIFLFLRPFKYGCSRCCGGVNDESKQNCPKAFTCCLIPPVIWLFVLLLDGEYVACGKTNWIGDYVFDKELNRSWCKPTEKMKENETELRDLTRKYIQRSQFAGYVLISVFSALAIVFVGIYDCCMSGKCDCCPSRLLSCCRRTAETRIERQNNVEADSVSPNDLEDSPPPAMHKFRVCPVPIPVPIPIPIPIPCIYLNIFI